MSTPFFSLVTVCYNAEGSIENTLQSAREQTCRDFENVVVDGASSDGTLDVVRLFDDLPVVLSSEPDKGIYDAMNKGIAKACGEVLYFLNADDRLHNPEVLAQVKRVFAQHPEVDLVWGNVVYDRPDGTSDHRTFGHIHPQNLVFLDLNHQGAFARRQLFERVGVFNTDFRINADYDWFLRVLGSGAAWRYEDIDIARFHTGGAHARNIQKLRDERHAVRMQYIHPLHYRIGALAHNLRHKAQRLGRILTGKEKL
ncbi:glycosyltransferase family 2 protein [Thiobacillus sp.]|uniref:glycosyltransferase family 2 protein n=1 Tax=Thiobacillus sp. TaxID=924 RepID=UPI0025DB6A44|nr:glycosyltransferase family 2 protein [Thiobacillus sp.]MBT9538267.1 glycosyltransferase [Thiobacillus sp.]